MRKQIHNEDCKILVEDKMDFLTSYSELYRDVFGSNKDILDVIASKSYYADIEKLPKEEEKLLVGKSIEAMIFLALSDGDVGSAEYSLIQSVCAELLKYTPEIEDLKELAEAMSTDDYDIVASMLPVRETFRKAICFRIIEVATPILMANEEITEAELQGLISLSQALGLRKSDVKRSIKKLVD